MDQEKRRALYGNILTIAIAMLFVAWTMFIWTATTGLTFATRSSRGRIASEKDYNRSKAIVVLTTIIAGPVALWSAAKRKQ